MGGSENIRRVCRKFGMKVVFRSSHSLRSVLTNGWSADGDAGPRGVPDPLQLWQSLHWRDQAEAGNQAEELSE